IHERPRAYTENRVISRKQGGCHFCGKCGHHVRNCYFQKYQYERTWRLNLCYIEPSTYCHVWIAKRDLYPKDKEPTQNGSHIKDDKPHITTKQNIVCNFASSPGNTEIVTHVSSTRAESSRQTDTLWYFASGWSKPMTGNQD